MSKFVDATLRLLDKFSSPLSKAVQNMQQQSRKINKISNDIKKAGKSVEGVGKNLTKGVTVPIVTVMTASGKMADTFEQNLGQVNTLLDDHSHLESYKNAALKTSNETGLNLDTVTQGVYQMISSIGDSGKTTEKIFNTSAKAAKAGGAEVSESVSLISSAMKGYNSINNETAKKISDMAFQTQKLGVTTYKELAASMQPLFPLGNALNVSYEELFGSMATLTGVTGNTAEVTTQMKGVFTGLMKPTDAMSKLMEKYGYKNGEAMIKAEGMAGVLKILKKETGGQSDKMAALFSNSRALTAVLALTGAQYDTFVDKSKKMKKATGSTDEALKNMQTSMTKIRKVINIVKNAMTIFGESVLQVVVPPATKLANKVQDLTEKFSKLDPKQKEQIVKMAMFAAAIGPVLVVLGKATQGVGKFIKTINGISIGIQKAGSFMKWLASPGTIVVAALIAIVAAGILVYKNWDKIVAGAKKMGKFIKQTMSDAGIDVEKWGKKINEVRAFASSGFKIIKQVISDFATILTPVGKLVLWLLKTAFIVGLKATIATIATWAQTIIDKVHGITLIFKGLIEFISGACTGNWEKAWKGMKKIFSGVFESLPGIIKTPLNSVISLVNLAISGINKLNFTVPDWVPGLGGKGFGGFNIPQIPHLAKGTQNWSGGVVQINEKGGEIVDLPRGTRVYPHDQSVRMAKSEGTKIYRFEKIADTVVVRKEEDIDMIVDKIVDKLEAIPC
ncbi:MAG: phage tail tape measure protein [Anaerobutyricum hallii]|uniref:phage tail tape measure protein n=1 Tax=Anaerobutyricum hallii TaxID=39488 RepID=UPI00399508E9